MGENKEILEITKPVSEISIEGENLENLWSFQVYEELKKNVVKKSKPPLIENG